MMSNAHLDFPYHLPGLESAAISNWTTLKYPSGIVVRFPDLTGEQLQIVMEHIRQRTRSYLRQRTVHQIVDSIDAAVHLWLDRSYLQRREAERILPLITGYDPDMVRLGLTQYLKRFRRPELLRLLDDELGNPLFLDEFRPRRNGGFAKAFGPELTTHVWAGNVPGLPLWSLVNALLVKSGSLGKVASGEPFFAGLFVLTLAEVDPQLADCIAITRWPGGDETVEKVVFSQSDVVLAYGSSVHVDQIRKRIPAHVRFLGYNNKISFGMIGKETLDPQKASDVARKAATDVSRYNQQGCYSPHLFYVEQGGRISPDTFAAMVAQELEAFEKKHPRAPLSVAEEASIQEHRSGIRMRQLNQQCDMGKSNFTMDSVEGTAWTVLYDTNTDIQASCLNRVIRIVPVEQLQSAVESLERFNQAQDLLQTVGLALGPERLFKLADQLGQAGVTRCCAIGEMTAVEEGWHHDGRMNLLDLIRWVDIDRSAEGEAQLYAKYRD